MTVTYSLEVSSTKLAGFGKLLLRWKGSVYKLIYRELIIFIFIFYSLAMGYRYMLNETQKRTFEEIALYCREFTDFIPMTFVMGFYVALVMQRWWQMYMNLPWPDRVAARCYSKHPKVFGLLSVVLYLWNLIPVGRRLSITLQLTNIRCCCLISGFIQGVDDRGRMVRRTLARYLNLMAVITLRATSPVIKKRFPTIEHIFEAGLMTDEERAFLMTTQSPHGTWFLPGLWFTNLAMQARKEGRIHDDIHLKSIIDEMLTYRSCCGMLFSYDWISLPLVYTQVVTIAVYCFFVACLFGRQYLYKDSPERERLGLVTQYVPLFTITQFFFYMGWLKVAEQMINPNGADDDDFELNYLLDRNVQVAYLMVDDLHKKYPKLERDRYYDVAQPEVPYTNASADCKIRPYLGSAIDVSVNNADMEWAPHQTNMEAVPEEDPSCMSSHDSLPRDRKSSVPPKPGLLANLVKAKLSTSSASVNSQQSMRSLRRLLRADSHMSSFRIGRTYALSRGSRLSSRASSIGSIYPDEEKGLPQDHPTLLQNGLSGSLAKRGSLESENSLQAPLIPPMTAPPPMIPAQLAASPTDKWEGSLDPIEENESGGGTRPPSRPNLGAQECLAALNRLADNNPSLFNAPAKECTVNETQGSIDETPLVFASGHDVSSSLSATSDLGDSLPGGGSQFPVIPEEPEHIIQQHSIESEGPDAVKPTETSLLC